MTTEGIEDLRESVELIRAAEFPDLAADVVVGILDIEALHLEDRGPAPRKVEELIDAFVTASPDA